jgi:hypothetical protein
VVGGTFPLGTVAGIHIRANWSVAIIFALIAFGLAKLQFPARAHIPVSRMSNAGRNGSSGTALPAEGWRVASENIAAAATSRPAQESAAVLAGSRSDLFAISQKTCHSYLAAALGHLQASAPERDGEANVNTP